MSGNTVSITGNITRDAEFRATQSGRVVASFGIAHNERRKDQQGQWTDVPSFFSVSAWMTDAQARSFEGRLSKGAKVAIVGGSLRQRSYTDRDGANRSAVEIVVGDPFACLVIEPPRQQRGGYQQQPQQQYQQPQQGYQQQPQQPQQATLYDQDIPF